MYAAPRAVDPRYPIGRFTPPAVVTPDLRASYFAVLANAPAALRAAVAGLDASQLQTPYRDGGWTVAQVVHHLADSHANAYLRIRLALTEETPTVHAYDQGRWAVLADATDPRIAGSMMLLEGLHGRLVLLLRSLGEAEFLRTYIHPERGPMTLDRTLALYSWHSTHHVAHITQLRDRLGW